MIIPWEHWMEGVSHYCINTARQTSSSTFRYGGFSGIIFWQCREKQNLAKSCVESFDSCSCGIDPIYIYSTSFYHNLIAIPLKGVMVNYLHSLCQRTQRSSIFLSLLPVELLVLPPELMAVIWDVADQERKLCGACRQEEQLIWVAFYCQGASILHGVCWSDRGTAFQCPDKSGCHGRSSDSCRSLRKVREQEEKNTTRTKCGEIKAQFKTETFLPMAKTKQHKTWVVRTWRSLGYVIPGKRRSLSRIASTSRTGSCRGPQVAHNGQCYVNHTER